MRVQIGKEKEMDRGIGNCHEKEVEKNWKYTS